MSCDLADRVARRAAGAGRRPPSTSFVSNAGLPGSGELTDYTGEQVDRALDVNLRAPMQLARLLVPGHARARRRPPRLRLLAGRQGPHRWGQRLRRDEVRAARLRRFAARRPARRGRRRLHRLPRLRQRRRHVRRHRRGAPGLREAHDGRRWPTASAARSARPRGGRRDGVLPAPERARGQSRPSSRAGSARRLGSAAIADRSPPRSATSASRRRSSPVPLPLPASARSSSSASGRGR